MIRSICDENQLSWKWPKFSNPVQLIFNGYSKDIQKIFAKIALFQYCTETGQNITVVVHFPDMLYNCLSNRPSDILIGWEPAEQWDAKRVLLENIACQKSYILHCHQVEPSKCLVIAHFPYVLYDCLSNMPNGILIVWEPAELWDAKRVLMDYRTSIKPIYCTTTFWSRIFPRGGA